MNRYAYTDEKRAHLHTLDGKPLIGTSSASGIIGKGDTLSWWAAELAAVEALTSGEHYPTLKEEYLEAKALKDDLARKKAMDALQKKYPAFRAARFAHYNRKNEAADTGTDMHAELETYVKECLTSKDGHPLGLTSAGEHAAVQSFAKWSVENVKRFLWSEAHCYSEQLWVGGITDCGAELKDGKIAILDFKSSKDAYFGQFVQAGGYAAQIQENGLFDAEGNQTAQPIKIDALFIVPFGAADTQPRPDYDVEGRIGDFAAAVRLYKHDQLAKLNK